VGRVCAFKFVIEEDNKPLKDKRMKRRLFNKLINNSKRTAITKSINIVPPP
jgi:hypothetical protein